MLITINSSIERVVFVSGSPVRVIDIKYTTDKGYEGTYTINKDKYDPDTIFKLIAEDVRGIHSTIGESRQVE